MIPDRVSASDVSALSLWREAAHSFRVVQPGALSCLITGHDFVLASRELADLLVVQTLGQISAVEVLIVRHATGEGWSSHVELSVERNLEHDSLPLSDFDDGLAWSFRGSALFVHPRIAATLRESSFPLAFANGFEGYG